jgi:hypothetical protein
VYPIPKQELQARLVLHDVPPTLQNTLPVIASHALSRPSIETPAYLIKFGRTRQRLAYSIKPSGQHDTAISGREKHYKPIRCKRNKESAFQWKLIGGMVLSAPG